MIEIILTIFTMIRIISNKKISDGITNQNLHKAGIITIIKVIVGIIVFTLFISYLLTLWNDCIYPPIWKIHCQVVLPSLARLQQNRLVGISYMIFRVFLVENCDYWDYFCLFYYDFHSLGVTAIIECICQYLKKEEVMG